MKLGIIFGGISTEHYVSVVSGSSIIKNLDKDKYQIYPIYIDKENNWYEVNEDICHVYEIGEEPKNIKKIDNILDYLKNLDVVFPVLHGLYGEDGTIQGLCKMFNIPCVGCGVLASALCMDKVLAKRILKQANINLVPDIYIEFINNEYYIIDSEADKEQVDLKKIDITIKASFGYPVFIKPANSGSSVGVTNANSIEELKESLKEASLYDKKILIEKAILGKEVECAYFIDNTSCVGEILSAEEFYTFDAKYKNSASKTVIPADIDKNIQEDIKLIAKRAFKAVDGNGLARIDFFIEDKTNNIYLNEINTMPGFTEISMYPKLVENMGYKYTELLDKLIENAK